MLQQGCPVLPATRSSEVAARTVWNYDRRDWQHSVCSQVRTVGRQADTGDGSALSLGGGASAKVLKSVNGQQDRKDCTSLTRKRDQVRMMLSLEIGAGQKVSAGASVEPG